MGIWYGHRKNEQYTKFAIARHESERRKEYELLVEEAKIAYAAQKDKELAAAVAPRTFYPFCLTLIVIIDPESYRFQPEDWIEFFEKQSQAEEAQQLAAKAALKK